MYSQSKRRGHAAFGILLTVLTVLADQAIKWLVVTKLPFGEQIDIAPFTSLLFTYNTGIAFSFLNTLTPPALLAIACSVVLFMIFLWWTARGDGLLPGLGYGLIIGGAIGNMIDRALLGKVVDYVFLHAGDFRFAVFNLADAALTLGVILILIASFLPQGRG